MFCSQCGAKNAHEALFCQTCGKQLEMMRQDSSTFLSPSPSSSTPYENSYYQRTASPSSEPIPPPPPDVAYGAIANPYEHPIPLQATQQKSRQRRRIVLSLMGIVLSLLLAVGGYISVHRSQPTSPTTSQSTPTLTTAASPSQVHVYDNAHVLNAIQVQNEASSLPYPIDIYTVTSFNGTKAGFDQRTASHLGNNPNLIVMAIDTGDRYLAIVGGKNVSTANSVYADAVNAFSKNFNNGDYTGATIAAIRSLRTSLGTAFI